MPSTARSGLVLWRTSDEPPDSADVCNQAGTSRVGASALWVLALEIAEDNFSPGDPARGAVILSDGLLFGRSEGMPHRVQELRPTERFQERDPRTKPFCAAQTIFRIVHA